jgi:glycosyltransferase involved in cell wall biosynthesis
LDTVALGYALDCEIDTSAAQLVGRLLKLRPWRTSPPVVPRRQIGRPHAANRQTIAYIGTYPPNACGIATFLLDLVSSTDLAGWRSIVFAVADDPIRYDDPKVVFEIDKENKKDYVRAARTINQYKASLLCIQHEYGIYGGDQGRYILDLARSVDVPTVATLHTVLPNPSVVQRRIIQELAECASALVVMAHKGERLLRNYGIPAHKIKMIPHGGPMVARGAEKIAKEKFGLAGRKVLSTFGLISPNKGIEDAIAAMPKIVEAEPDAHYLILGQTHPTIRKRHGEQYRETLIEQVNNLGLREHVQFVNRYLSMHDLLDYLLATDVYVTPYYANPNQITSGTLAYAMTAGKVIVSTPYTHAQELLADGRGFIFPFRDSAKLAEIIVMLLEDQSLYNETKDRAVEFGRNMTWPRVGIEYLKMYSKALDRRPILDSRIRQALTLVEDQVVG